MAQKTATIIGATGLIGSHLLQQLQVSDAFDTIKVIGRRTAGYKNPKTEELVIDFEDEAAFKKAIKGSDAVFCAVGTTNKKVNGNKTAYRKVDFDIPVNAARFTAETGCNIFAIISAVGADSNSKNFYTRLKGEMEEAVQQQNISTLLIFRPSLLLGKRNETRIAESLGKWIMKPLSFLIPARMKPIEAEDIAKAMIHAANSDLKGNHIFHYPEIKTMQRI
ncbi:NAD(P)H-binding protein [Marinilabilia salmonicolor]|uniref:NAD(P)H-binding protein n=1 Tax=Marinilabilia salmonicolor TaxID=989 RepID=UPI00029AFA51|nr:NAD(P)H-binding protein [Marinilabilia salmonicolor]